MHSISVVRPPRLSKFCLPRGHFTPAAVHSLEAARNRDHATVGRLPMQLGSTATPANRNGLSRSLAPRLIPCGAADLLLVGMKLRGAGPYLDGKGGWRGPPGTSSGLAVLNALLPAAGYGELALDRGRTPLDDGAADRTSLRRESKGDRSRSESLMVILRPCPD